MSQWGYLSKKTYISLFVENIFNVLVLEVYPASVGINPKSDQVEKAKNIGLNDWSICPKLIPHDEPNREGVIMMALYQAAQESRLRYGTPEHIGRTLMGGSWAIAGKLMAPQDPLLTCPARLGKALYPWYDQFSRIYSQWYSNELASK